ncbi:hypothetical protein V8G54_036876 [Vigna mungo]|uniref:Uncharacterized protein n=1 Tax=Vigna mungo TaxID=3915 RepID=A0AAQ3RG06_VIGMU
MERNSLRIEFSPTENLSYTPNLGVGAPFQVPPPSGQDLKITGRSKSTQSMRKTESDVIKVSPSVPKIYTETFWRPPWGRMANPNGDHEEHGGTTKHQKDDNKQRRAFGLNITTPYQHQEISLKRRLHNMSYHLYKEFHQQDKGNTRINQDSRKNTEHDAESGALSRPDLAHKSFGLSGAYHKSKTELLLKQLPLLKRWHLNRPVSVISFRLLKQVWIQKQDQAPCPSLSGRNVPDAMSPRATCPSLSGRNVPDAMSHRATSPPLYGHNVPPGDKPATLRTQRPTGRQARHFTDTTSHRATSPPLCGHNVPPGDKPGIFRTQRPTGRQARYSQDTQSDRHNNAAKIHRAPTKLSPSVRQEANPSLSLGLGGDDVRWCILKVKRVIGLEAQHQNKRIPSTFSGTSPLRSRLEDHRTVEINTEHAVEVQKKQTERQKATSSRSWHQAAFHDLHDNVCRMLHSRAEVPFQVLLEVNVVLIGFNGDGGYRYNIDVHQRITGELLDMKHHMVYNAFRVSPAYIPSPKLYRGSYCLTVTLWSLLVWEEHGHWRRSYYFLEMHILKD